MQRQFHFHSPFRHLHYKTFFKFSSSSDTTLSCPESYNSGDARKLAAEKAEQISKLYDNDSPMEENFKKILKSGSFLIDSSHLIYEQHLNLCKYF